MAMADYTIHEYTRTEFNTLRIIFTYGDPAVSGWRITEYDCETGRELVIPDFYRTERTCRKYFAVPYPEYTAYIKLALQRL